MTREQRLERVSRAQSGPCIREDGRDTKPGSLCADAEDQPWKPGKALAATSALFPGNYTHLVHLLLKTLIA